MFHSQNITLYMNEIKTVYTLRRLLFDGID